MRRSIRRAVVSAALIAAMGLGGTGCSGSSGTGGDGGGSSKAPTGKTLTGPQLAAAALTPKELPAGYGLVKPKTATALFKSTATATPAVCQPVQDIGAGRPTAALAQNYPRTAGKTQVLASRITAYAAGDAEKTMADLRTALEHCTSYQAKDNKDGTTATVRVAAGQAPALGDEAVRFDLSTSTSGRTVTLRMVLVRTGSTIALFSAFDLRSGKALPVPEQVVSAQVDKLRAALG